MLKTLLTKETAQVSRKTYSAAKACDSCDEILAVAEDVVPDNVQGMTDQHSVLFDKMACGDAHFFGLEHG